MNFIKALIKFVPIIILAGLMMSGQDALLAATIAAVAAVIVAKLTEKISFKECMDAAMDSVKNIIVALFILMFAYAMASAFMTTGVGAVPGYHSKNSCGCRTLRNRHSFCCYRYFLGNLCRMRPYFPVAGTYR